METIQTTASSAPKATGKYSKKQITLMVIAVIATVLDCVLGFITGDDKSSPIGISKDVAHLVSIAAIATLLFFSENWASSFTKLQKPVIGVAVILYSAAGVMDLVNHTAGMEDLIVPSLITSTLAFAAVIAVFIIGIISKRRNK